MFPPGNTVKYRKVGEKYYKSIRFVAPGSYSLDLPEGTDVSYLIIGGGGSGGRYSSEHGSGGGGGAGEVKQGTVNLGAGVHAIVVGAGAIPPTAYRAAGFVGEDSEAFGVVARGGGGGGSRNGVATSGGSGGGGGRAPNRWGAAGVGTLTNSGGNAGSTARSGAGGGGAGGGGSHAQSGTGHTYGGNGGPGVQIEFAGETAWYAAGGGGGSRQSGRPGDGGSGIGGDGSAHEGTWYRPATSGADGTGSGGGGSNGTYPGSPDPGLGGSGIVAVEYEIPESDLPPVFGGLISYTEVDGTSYTVHSFTSSHTFHTNINLAVEYLAVGGGGGGGTGSGGYYGGGGGGGGGVLEGSLHLTDGEHEITIGQGGAGRADSESTNAPGGQGGDSSIGALVISVGGGGGGSTSGAGSAGGSGGGAPSIYNPPGAGVAGQGHAGGAVPGSGGRNGGGGGGGAGEPGHSPTGSSSGYSLPEGYGADGGDGLATTIRGYVEYFGGGGGGGNNASASTGEEAGQGGLGGGGNAGTLGYHDAKPGAHSTGGGGGASSTGYRTSGPGGDGIVVLRYVYNPDDGSIFSLPGPLQAPQAQAFSKFPPSAEIAIGSPVGASSVTVDVLYNNAPNHAPTDLVPSMAWNYAASTFAVHVEWAHVADISGVAGFDGYLEYGDEVVPFDVGGTEATVVGVPAETGWTLHVRAYNPFGFGPYAQTSGTTGVDPPGQVTGITFLPTASSLSFEWDARLDADAYLARLYRDGSPVEEQDTVATEALFETLEDGTGYVLEVSGYNVTGVGHAGVREAQTLYLVPGPPSNLRQEGETFVLVRAQWDAPASKVTFYHSQLIIEDPFWKVYDETLPATPLERLYPAPLAGTQYKWRLRAATPAGYSTWVEADVTTAWLQPDSRLAALPAAYQEDFLFPDTWPAGTDVGEAQPEPVHAGLEFFAGHLRSEPVYRDRASVGFDVQGHEWLLGVSLVQYEDDNDPDRNRAAIGFFVEGADFIVGISMVSPPTQPEERSSLAFAVTGGSFDVGLSLFAYDAGADRAAIGFAVTDHAFSIGVP